VLTVGGHKYVLTDASPVEPATNTSEAIIERFDH
jgi:hypothetical protein